MELTPRSVLRTAASEPQPRQVYSEGKSHCFQWVSCKGKPLDDAWQGKWVHPLKFICKSVLDLEAYIYGLDRGVLPQDVLSLTAGCIGPRAGVWTPLTEEGETLNSISGICWSTRWPVITLMTMNGKRVRERIEGSVQHHKITIWWSLTCLLWVKDQEEFQFHLHLWTEEEILHCYSHLLLLLVGECCCLLPV